jgi:hypothetical protein
MAQLILEISGPRLGSTTFRRKLEGFGGIMSVGELFNRRPRADPDHGDALLEAARRLGHAPGPDAVAMRSWAADSPVEAIAVALEAAREAGRSHAVVKVAPGHLSSPRLAEIVDLYRPVGIVLLRAPIDQYISRQKALSLGAWRSVDTTQMRPRIDAAAFRAARRRQQNHCRMGLYLLRRFECPVAILRYETLYAEGRDPLDVIRETFAGLGVSLPPASSPSDDLARQDRSGDRSEKVSNWADFHAEMARLGALEELDEVDLDFRPALMRAQIAVEAVASRSLLRRVSSWAGMSGMPEHARGRTGPAAGARAKGRAAKSPIGESAHRD